MCVCECVCVCVCVCVCIHYIKSLHRGRLRMCAWGGMRVRKFIIIISVLVCS
jgi:hypothetical protein